LPATAKGSTILYLEQFFAVCRGPRLKRKAFENSVRRLCPKKKCWRGTGTVQFRKPPFLPTKVSSGLPTAVPRSFLVGRNGKTIVSSAFWQRVNIELLRRLSPAKTTTGGRGPGKGTCLELYSDENRPEAGVVLQKTAGFRSPGRDWLENLRIWGPARPSLSNRPFWIARSREGAVQPSAQHRSGCVLSK